MKDIKYPAPQALNTLAERAITQPNYIRYENTPCPAPKSSNLQAQNFHTAEQAKLDDIDFRSTNQDWKNVDYKPLGPLTIQTTALQSKPPRKQEEHKLPVYFSNLTRSQNHF